MPVPLARTIGTMPICGQGWITPWTVDVNRDGAWLDTSLTIHDQRCGTRNVLITRTAEGYTIHLDRLNYYQFGEFKRVGSVPAKIQYEVLYHPRPLVIDEMAVDQQGWVAPWNLLIDKAGRGWIRPHEVLSPQTMNLNEVLIERTVNGYSATIAPDTEYRWEIADQNALDHFRCIQITEIKRVNLAENTGSATP
jgi:hypothetical protein